MSKYRSPVRKKQRPAAEAVVLYIGIYFARRANNIGQQAIHLQQLLLTKLMDIYIKHNIPELFIFKEQVSEFSETYTLRLIIYKRFF